MNRSVLKGFMAARFLVLVFFGLTLSGCVSRMVNSIIFSSAENMQYQTDLELICDGGASFLLLVDSMVVSSPEDVALRISATKAYSAYIAAVIECGRPERAASLSLKAKEYGFSLLESIPSLKNIRSMTFAEIENGLLGVGLKDVGPLFWGAYGWGTWVLNQGGSPESLADLIKIEKIMIRVLELDDAFYNGAGHLFLGIYYGGRPKIYGGRIEEGRKHFERALVISNRQFLQVQLSYAETVARMLFDRDLYESLLREIIDFPLASRPDLTLINQIAKNKAKKLLENIDLDF